MGKKITANKNKVHLFLFAEKKFQNMEWIEINQ